MLKLLEILSGWCHKDFRAIYKLWRWRIVKQDESDANSGIYNDNDLKVDRQVIEIWTKDNYKNGKEYVELIETPYWNMMLDRWIIKTKEKTTRHKLLLSQEVIWCEIWIRGFHKKHNYKQ